jgi:hypothetical protein
MISGTRYYAGQGKRYRSAAANVITLLTTSMIGPTRRRSTSGTWKRAQPRAAGRAARIGSRQGESGAQGGTATPRKIARKTMTLSHRRCRDRASADTYSIVHRAPLTVPCLGPNLTTHNAGQLTSRR